MRIRAAVLDEMGRPRPYARSRPLAIDRMKRALDEYRVVGIETNLAFHRLVMDHPAFREGVYDTGFIEAHKDELTPRPSGAGLLAAAVVGVAAHEAAAEERSRRTGAQAGREGVWSTWRQAVRWRRA